MVGLTPLERDIIQLLTQHISCNEEISLTELAEECHVAKSTVVKAVQKLGYGGFGDLTYNIRLNAQSAGGLLPRRPVSGDVDDQVDRLSRLLWSCRDKHSILFSGDHRIGAPLSSYMCRKLAMFGIFASASYDYLMVEHHCPPDRGRRYSSSTESCRGERIGARLRVRRGDAARRARCGILNRGVFRRPGKVDTSAG